MTASHPIDVEKLLEKQLATASPDLLRALLSTFIAAVGALLAALAVPSPAHRVGFGAH
ncbi:hypothetical protein MAHJHV47_46000 [Mycobacterium avium subsp. hominissuis]